MNLAYDHAAMMVQRIYDKRIEGPPVLDLASHFPDAGKFVGSWREIRAEALAVAADLQGVPRFHEIMREQVDISANDGRDWRVFMLKAYGIEHPQNMARCPSLTALVSGIPDVLSASISFLAPGKHIPVHRGPFRGVLRFHLGLSMPRSADGTPAAVLKIADAEYRIADGECLLWDDTYPHEVWNSSNQVRTALLLDVRRRHLPTDMELFSRLLIAVVRAGIRLRGLS
jgi:aspartate beta-hydroxylase